MYLVVFGLIFCVALLDYVANKTLLDFGMPPRMANLIIILFSVLGIVKTLYHLASY